MTNQKLALKLTLLIGAAWATGLVATSFLIYRLDTVGKVYETRFEQDVRFLDHARLVQVGLKKQVQEWKDILLRGHEPESLRKYSMAFQAAENVVRKEAGQLTLSAPEPEIRKMCEAFTDEHEKMSIRYAQALRLFVAEGAQNPREADKLVKGQDRWATDLMDRIVKKTGDRLARVAAEQKQQVASDGRNVAAVVGTCFLVLMPLSILMFRQLTKQLAHAAAELLHGAEQIKLAANELKNSGQALARAGLEHTEIIGNATECAQRMSSAMAQTSILAGTSTTVINTVDKHVHTSNRKLQEMTGSMEKIRASSDRIAKIIRVIDEIAFQTNILALNAAVEAARAGDAGKGFAVVADEVRNLAQRCASAARDTTDLIDESRASANEGSVNLEEVTEAICLLTASTRQVRSLVEQVSSCGAEQVLGLEMIGRCLQDVDHTSQTNAAAAEETAHAGSAVASQVDRLRAVAQGLNEMVEGRSR